MFQQGNNRASKLSGQEVLEIREKYKVIGGYTYGMLSREYGVSVNTISNIINGVSWQRMAGQDLVARDKPPISRREYIPQPGEIEASMARLDLLMKSNTTTVKPPSLYNDPSPTEAEDNEAGRLGLERLAKELDGPQPTRQREVEEGLGELEGEGNG